MISRNIGSRLLSCFPQICDNLDQDFRGRVPFFDGFGAMLNG